MADFERARSHYTHDPTCTTEDAALVHPAYRTSPSKDDPRSLHSLKRALSNDDLSRLRMNDRTVMTPTSHARDQLGLPPTPPTLTNSDVAEPRGDTLATNPQFADAVRKALNTHTFEQQVVKAPTLGHHALQTPDPTPPAARHEVKVKAAPIRPALVLRPMSSHPRSSPSLNAGLSSRAESFHTAQESANTSQLHLAQELSPPASPPPQNGSREEQDAILYSLDPPAEDEDGDTNTVGGTATPRLEDNLPRLRPLSLSLEFSDHDLEKHLRELKLVSDSPLIRRSNRLSVPSPPESPEDAPSSSITRSYIPKEEGMSECLSEVTAIKAVGNPASSLTPPPTKNTLRHTDNSPRSNITRHVSEHSADFGPPSGDMDKHVTYIEDEADELEPERPVLVDSVDDAIHQASHESSAEGLNNDVYREIRENNVKRHSVGGSLPVGIIIPRQPKRTLKRMSRYDSLRKTVSEGVRSPQRSVGTPQRLRHKKPLPVKSLEASPESDVQPSARHSSAVDVHSSPMTSITREAIAEDELDNVPSIWQQHSLRRSSKTDRLERLDPSLMSKSETSVHKRQISGASQDTHTKDTHKRDTSEVSLESPRLRHFSRDVQLENNPHVRRTSLEVPPVRASVDSGRSQADPRFLNPNATPLSTTVSYRTDAEVCEATGMTLYPVNEENAVQVVHHTSSQPVSPIDDHEYDDVELHFPIRTPPPEVMLRRRTMPALQKPEIHIESPLLHPREAPEPPVINFIPPTPSNELEVLLMDEMAVAPPAKRNVSLKDRARRYSESYIVPLFTRSLSYRRNNPRPVEDDVRPGNLSPMWRPRYFWEDYESDEEYNEDEFESSGALPPGGDTSEVQDRNRTFPRNMSVRMPGFRGNGGFLVGNSLGLDRHGTNNRRHHIVPRRASDEVLRADDRRRRNFLPFSSREKGRRFRVWREQREVEKRRATLRGSIQHNAVIPTE